MPLQAKKGTAKQAPTILGRMQIPLRTDGETPTLQKLVSKLSDALDTAVEDVDWKKMVRENPGAEIQMLTLSPADRHVRLVLTLKPDTEPTAEEEVVHVETEQTFPRMMPTFGSASGSNASNSSNDSRLYSCFGFFCA